MPKTITVNVIAESEFTVQGHGVHTAYLELTRALKGQPRVSVSVNDSNPADIIHIHSTGPYGLSKMLKRRGNKVVSAHIVPDSLVGSIVGGKAIKPLSKAYLKYFYKKADLVLSPSQAVTEELTNDMKLNNVRTFYNSIDTLNYRRTASDRKKARQALSVANDQFVVISNGQIQPRKRFDLFVDLAKKNPNIRFFWVGGIPFKAIGAESAKMNRLIKQAPSNLTVTGVIDLSEVKQYYHAADLFILPSDQETFGLAVVEAAASGLPVLIRDIHHYNDTFKPDAALAKNDADFYGQLSRFAAMPPVEYQKWVQKSKNIAERFDSRTAAKKLVKYYQELVEA